MPSGKKIEPKIIFRKHKLHKYTQHVISTTSQFYLSRMEKLKSRGYYREMMFGHEIVWNQFRYTFDDKDVKTKKDIKSREMGKKNMFIFALVQKDALTYVKKNKIKPSAWLPSVHYNENFRQKNAKICAVDLDGAYWRIAWQMGVISENTYNHGTRIKDKALCLAALANLGADKSYKLIDRGQLTSTIVTVKGNDYLKNAYNSIRHTCFGFMQALAGILENDFIEYHTDCIYFVKNKKNVQAVIDFLTDHELDYKVTENISKYRLAKR